MGAKLNLFTAIAMFALLISTIPAVFNLEGNLFIVEFFVICALIIFGTMTVMELLNRRNMWTAMFVFFAINAVNLFVIYFSTYNLTSLAVPFIAVILGLYASGFKVRNNDDAEIEPYYEESKEEEPAKPKKKSKKKAKKSK